MGGGHLLNDLLLPDAPHGRAPARLARPAAAVGLVVGAGLAGIAAAIEPRLAVLLTGGALAVWLAARHLTAAVALLCASFYFDHYLTGGATGLTGTKALGALAIVAWAVNWAIDRRPLVASPQLVVLGGFAVWILLSSVAARNESVAVTSAMRYWALFAVVFLLVQEIGQEPARARTTIGFLVIAGGVAGYLGAAAFLFGGADRASGPIEDPNDFAIVLGATLPLVVYQLSVLTFRPARLVMGIAGIGMVAGILGSFSRGAAVALTAGLLWAVLTRRWPARWLVGVLACVLLVVGAAYVFQRDTIEAALGQKEHIAEENVSSRFDTWSIAWREFKAEPILGVGPGNYRERFLDFELPEDVAIGPLVTHNMYLSALAELGAPGLAFLVAFLGVAYLQLRKRTPYDPASDAQRTALCMMLIIAAVGSLFIDGQYVPAMYLAVGIGAGLTAAASSRATADVPVSRS